MNHPYDIDKVERVHLSHFLDHTSPAYLEPFPASFVEPCAYWSRVEKASFFQSLARHSRWKPDLIAEDIGGGRTIADVCSYIELLEQGSARASRKRCRRDAYPTAHEVSEEWIAVENAVSESLCGKDAEWQKAALKHTRAQELKDVKNSLRKGMEIKTESGSGDNTLPASRNPKRKGQASTQGEHEEWEERFKARKQELCCLWKREDMLSSLDGRYLKTMDKMIQTLENTEAAKTTEGGDQLVLEDLGRDWNAQLDVSATPKFTHEVDAPFVDHRLESMSDANEVDLQIDPLLLALDRTVANPRTVSPAQVPDNGREPVASSSDDLHSAVLSPSQLPALEPFRVQNSTKDVRSLRAQSLVIDPVSQTSPASPHPVAEIPRDLSPASRRRIRKRVWTRRKRAMESGLPISEVPMDMAELKRGRKAKTKALDMVVRENKDISETQCQVDPRGAPEAMSHPCPSYAPSHLGVQDHAVDEAEDDANVTDRLESAPKRRPYGWSKLTARHTSGPTLRADGVDLFHLEKFVSVMSLLGHVHGLSNESDYIDESGESNQEPSTLSYPLLRLLRACVVRFVTCLVAYTVLHKDVETRQKRRIRGIFRTGGADEIRAENVRNALLHMAKETSAKQFFTRLKRTVSEAITAQSGKEDDPERRDTDNSDEMGSSDAGSRRGGRTEDDTLSCVGSLSARFSGVFQLAFPPPCGEPEAASPLFWNPSVLSAFSEKQGDSLLSANTDEAELWKELKAEEKTEEADCEAARMHECELWIEIGVRRVEQDGADVGAKSGSTKTLQRLKTEAGPSHSLRFRQPGGAVKSSVYIDSGEDI